MRSLEGQVAELMQEKREVEVRHKILMTDLVTWQDHVRRLSGIKVGHEFPTHPRGVGGSLIMRCIDNEQDVTSYTSRSTCVSA